MFDQFMSNMSLRPRIGIDATNLLGGGGLTHLIELLSEADPGRHDFSEIVVWGRPDTLAQLPDRGWLKRRFQSPRVTKDLLSRSLWQLTRLSREARKENCDVLFIPGGSFFGRFRPFVAMSQNMLPFERRERARYGISLKAARLLMLSMTQYLTFLRADSLISLSQHAKSMVQKTRFMDANKISVICHGVNARFYSAPRLQRDVSTYGDDAPLRLLYVSPIEPYKHHGHVIAALVQLRAQFGWPLHLTLIGPASITRREELIATIRRHDPQGAWISYLGFVPFDDIDNLIKGVDIGIFASSCEACPNVVIEYMAAGLPIAASDDGPMPEVLDDGAIYFDPEDRATIERALAALIESPELRTRTANRAFERAHALTWAKCADLTFSVLEGTARQGMTSGPEAADQ